MDDEQIWSRIAAHLAGECSEAEERELLAWAAEKPSHAKLFETARETWAMQGSLGAAWNPPADWAEIERRLGGGAIRQSANRPLQFTRPPARGSMRRKAIAAAIAVLVVSGAAGVMTRGPSGPEQEVVALREVETHSAERKTITLPDGTRVMLAPGSRLGIPSQFADGVRQVQLTGEAYFDVPHDPSRPFTVVAGAAVVRVLGTEFDVRAYPSDARMQVVVAEGRVSLRPRVAIEREATVLAPGELGEVAAGGNVVRSRRVDLERYLGWREGVLAFDDASLTQVAADLERWYGVQVRVAGASLVNRRLTAIFHDRPLDEVMATISTALGIDYARTGKTYTFFPEGGLASRALSRRAPTLSSGTDHAPE